MSYAKFDHAGWVKSETGQEISDLGKTVANIIGFVGGGIYNCPIKLSKTDWTNKRYIEINWRSSLCNYDKSDLSYLWILCHRRMIRVDINPCNMHYLTLRFWQRGSREGDISTRLPDCEEMIKIVDECFEDAGK